MINVCRHVLQRIATALFFLLTAGAASAHEQSARSTSEAETGQSSGGAFIFEMRVDPVTQVRFDGRISQIDRERPFELGYDFSLRWTATSNSLAGGQLDIYLGVITPLGVVTWVPGSSVRDPLEMRAGLQPFVRSFALSYNAADPSASSIPSVAAGAIGPARVVFSPALPPGVYIPFGLLVQPGKDPLDGRNWVWSAATLLSVR